MANLHLVTGYNGGAHVTAADQGILNAMGIGTGEYVFPKGQQFKAEIIDSNTVRIYDGSLLMNGRQVNLDAGAYIDMTIANGTAGMKRHDIIVIRYRLDSNDGIERVQMLVQQGTASASAVDPDPRYQDSILDGATAHEMPLYRVVVEGLTITKVEPLFQLLAPMADLHNGFRTTNMLINGDFFINQRNTSTYNASNAALYTADMWRAYKMTVKVLPGGGVELTGASEDVTGYFTQFIQLGKLKGIQYTISAKVDDKICTFTVAPGASAKSKDFGKFTISALTTSTWDSTLNGYNNKLKINICTVGLVTIKIEYVDVFEGTVAYPHVPEDPALALARCRRYVQNNSFSCPVFKAETGDGGNGAEYRIMIPYEGMYSEPTVQYCGWRYLDKNDTWQNGSTFTTYDTAPSGCKQVGTEYRQLMHPNSNCVCGTCVFTCEPQDA